MTNLVTGTQIIVDDQRIPRVRRLRLEVKRGPDKGKTQDLDDEPIRIGSSEGCEFYLSDATVSGIHAEIQRTKHGLLLRDLGSTNGTLVDKRRIQGVYANSPLSITVGNSDIRLTPLREETIVELSSDDKLGELVGSSAVMRALFAKLKRISGSDTTVLITGETGTGKELGAAAIRDHSARHSKPFVVVDCGAMPANLIESELFGHERGAFTGADRTRRGAFERANGGTIFLDEIGELPLNLQPALLGILERRETRRVGGQKMIPVDVRVITATNRDLANEVTRGAFRPDLYYRLAVVEVKMPPLRDHIEDIPLLIENMLTQLPGEKPIISKDTIEQLMQYSWPGNVRELRNVIERAALLAEPPELKNKHKAFVKENTELSIDIERPFKELKNELISLFEQKYVKQLISTTQGNIAAAARKARIDRMYLYKLIERYQVNTSTRK